MQQARCAEIRERLRSRELTTDDVAALEELLAQAEKAGSAKPRFNAAAIASVGVAAAAIVAAVPTGMDLIK